MASTPTPPFAPTGRPLTRAERRAVRRAGRSRSIVGPLLLVGMGVVALLLKMGRLHWQTAILWYGRWWPLLLIAAGALLVVEWAIDHARRQGAAAGTPSSYVQRRVGAGAIWLLVLAGLVGAGLHSSMVWNGPERYRGSFFDLDMAHAIGAAHDSDEALTQALAADGSVSIDNPQGDVIVSGASDDGKIHIAVHKQVYAYTDEDASSRAAQLRPQIANGSGYMTIRVASIGSGHADLTVMLPKTVALTVTAGHGQVRVNGIHGEVTVNGDRGDVDLSDLDGAVYAHMHNSDATLSAHNMAGPLTIDGHTGDINISGVRGAVSLNGNFFGTTHLEKLGGALRYHTSRTDLQIARLDGELEFDTGSNLHADQLVGPVVLKTSDRVITLDRVQGEVELVNSNGAVTVNSVVPLGTVNISNRRGSVDLAVPATAGFHVAAATKHGEINNDFGMKVSSSEDAPELTATVGNGATSVHIETTDGDINIRKSSGSR